MKRIDLTGERFGRLLVLKQAPRLAKDRNARWSCRCDCGQKAIVRTDLLCSGLTTSCGCFQKEVASAQMTTHGMTNTREFSIWHTMRARCHRPSSRAYKTHGARGIKVCERWRDSFENFYADMGPRPSPKHSIDRIDNNGDYTPENCRWATSYVQARNTRYNRHVEMDGVSFIVADWCALMGVSPHRPYDMKYWNKRSGIKTVEEALRVLYDEWKQHN